MDLCLGKAKWDSLRIEIPEEKVRVINSINIPYIKVAIKDNWDGLVIGGTDEEPLTDKHYVDNSYGVGISMTYQTRHFGPHETEKRVVLHLNAKHLGSRYWEGLTMDNIRIAYDYIISKNIIWFSFEDFMNAYAYDCDVCYDFEADNDMMLELCSRIDDLIDYEKRLKYNSMVFKNMAKGNVGWQINNRNNSSATLPFIKIYSKGQELCSNSLDFNRHYLGGLIHKVGRLEFNIKSKRFWDNYDISVVSLTDLLTLSMEKMRDFILSSVKRFYIERRVIMKMNENLSPTKFYTKWLMEVIMQNGLFKSANDFKQAVGAYGKYSNDRKAISNLKLLITKALDDEAYDALLDKYKKQKTKNVDEILKQMGLSSDYDV
jgi:hypothetical protein